MREQVMIIADGLPIMNLVMPFSIGLTCKIKFPSTQISNSVTYSVLLVQTFLHFLSPFRSAEFPRKACQGLCGAFSWYVDQYRCVFEIFVVSWKYNISKTLTPLVLSHSSLDNYHCYHII